MWNFNELCKDIKSLDWVAVNEYNNKPRRKREFVLNTELGPCPFEGDINNAPVVLLLGNPSSKGARKEDHTAPTIDWPLGGLSPEASAELYEWWSKRLRTLIDVFSLQTVAKSIAALQLNPWASENFDADCTLPSRELMLEVAESVVEKAGRLLVVIRGRRQWEESSALAGDKSILHTKSPRCSYVSERNLYPDSWTKINRAIRTFSSEKDIRNDG